VKAANVGHAAAHDWRPAEELPRAAEALKRARRVLVFIQRGPDGDACGASLGLCAALREMGNEVVAYVPDAVPHAFRFMPGADAVLAGGAPPPGPFDATVVCDIGQLSRLGAELPPRETRGIVVNIDHHLAGEPFGDVNLVDPHAAATGAVVHRLIRAMGAKLSRDAAVCLYTSLVCDTGSFRYGSTDPEAFRVAAELLEAGADPWEVSSRIYESQPPERLRLLAEVLRTVEFEHGGRYATLVISQQSLAAAGATYEMTDGFINFARGVSGVEVAAQFAEQTDGSFRVSFRSRGRVNVAAIAQSFGGGGHLAASGFAFKGTLSEAKSAVSRAVREALAPLPAP
jgi:phosphoesterase RecJ-like protein